MVNSLEDILRITLRLDGIVCVDRGKQCGLSVIFTVFSKSE